MVGLPKNIEEKTALYLTGRAARSDLFRAARDARSSAGRTIGTKNFSFPHFARCAEVITFAQRASYDRFAGRIITRTLHWNGRSKWCRPVSQDVCRMGVQYFLIGLSFFWRKLRPGRRLGGIDAPEATVGVQMDTEQNSHRRGN